MRLTMGTFAGMHHVSRKLLRYYRQIGLLMPAGIDPENGYAYYGEAESGRLRKILYLRNLRFPLEEIRELLTLDAKDVEKAARRRLMAVRAEMRMLAAIERELQEIILHKPKREVFIPMNSKEKFAVTVFDLKEPMYAIGRGAIVPYGKPDEKMPLIIGVIEGFFGDDVSASIVNPVSPLVRLGIVGEYDHATGIGLYMMGDQVEAIGEIPEGCRSFTVPAGKYASVRFYAPDKEALTGSALVEANDYLYRKWLPASGYVESDMMQVEIYRNEEFEIPSNPAMEVWAPVKEKQ